MRLGDRTRCTGTSVEYAFFGMIGQISEAELFSTRAEARSADALV
jgi:hypothetical protein